MKEENILPVVEEDAITKEFIENYEDDSYDPEEDSNE